MSISSILGHTSGNIGDLLLMMSGAEEKCEKKEQTTMLIENSPIVDHSPSATCSPDILDCRPINPNAENALESFVTGNTFNSMGRSMFSASAVTEAIQLKAMQALCGRFSQLCENTIGSRWFSHWEKWLWSQRSAIAENNDTSIPIIPVAHRSQIGSTEADENMKRKLIAGGDTPDEAMTKIAKLNRSTAVAVRAVDKVRKRHCGSGNAKISFEYVKDTNGNENEEDAFTNKIKLRCAGATVELTTVHFEKLVTLHRRMATRNKNKTSVQPDQSEQNYRTKNGSNRLTSSQFSQHELQDIFSVSARYTSLQGGHYKGGSMQAALPAEAFDTLRKYLGVCMECFASPLNTRYFRFCSAFSDTDSVFGSVGSFFDFQPIEGSYEANPPFEPSIINRMTNHISNLLENAESKKRALSFVVIIPYWPNKDCWKFLSQNKFLQECNGKQSLGATWHLPSGEHGYYVGSQHNMKNVSLDNSMSNQDKQDKQDKKDKKSNRFRVSVIASSIFLFQTSKASTIWPLDTNMYDCIAKGFSGPIEINKNTKNIKQISDGNEEKNYRKTVNENISSKKQIQYGDLSCSDDDDDDENFSYNNFDSFKVNKKNTKKRRKSNSNCNEGDYSLCKTQYSRHQHMKKKQKQNTLKSISIVKPKCDDIKKKIHSWSDGKYVKIVEEDDINDEYVNDNNDDVAKDEYVEWSGAGLTKLRTMNTDKIWNHQKKRWMFAPGAKRQAKTAALQEKERSVANSAIVPKFIRNSGSNKRTKKNKKVKKKKRR